MMKSVDHSRGIRALLPRPNVLMPVMPATARVVADYLHECHCGRLHGNSWRIQFHSRNGAVCPYRIYRGRFKKG